MEGWALKVEKIIFTVFSSSQPIVQVFRSSLAQTWFAIIKLYDFHFLRNTTTAFYSWQVAPGRASIPIRAKALGSVSQRFTGVQHMLNPCLGLGIPAQTYKGLSLQIQEVLLTHLGIR